VSEEKSWGRTVLGWFVVQDGQADSGTDFGSPTIGAVHRHAVDAPARPAVSALDEMPEVFEKAVPPAPGGNVDYDAVFDAAGIGDEDQERVNKAVALLGSLPADTDPVVRKQIVEASLKAFGVPIEKIIETGVQQIEALEGYIRTGARDTTTLIQESEERIRALERQIEEIRTVMKQTVEEQQGVIRSCNEKKLEVQQILEFFGREAVERVVRDSPKLHEPGPSQSDSV
jgi:hypothetical protein